jgi:hypothetical protein
MPTPITRGITTSISSGLAMAQALTVRPSTMNGTANGISITVPADASRMNVAA